MKRMMSLLLCLCFALGGCAQGNPVPHTEGGGETAPGGHASQPEPNGQDSAASSLEQLALGLAVLPELPKEPDESALWAEINALDFDALGAEKYSEEQNRLREEFSAQQAAYDEALRSLRGDGVDNALTPSFLKYTLRTARQLFSGAGEKNVVYSPANLYLALCMLCETTDGESRAQLLELLGLSSVEQAREAANSLFRSLYNDSATGRTLLANSLWLNEQVNFNQDTIDKLAADYYASAFRAAMGDKATDAAIHEWINENTNHLLENAANGLETNADTLMMLISTLYFKGTWADQFEKFATGEDVFTAANGAEQRVDFMHRNEKGNYYRIGSFTAAALPFRDGTSMWFLLPDEGTAADDVWQLIWNLPMLAVDTENGCYEIPDLSSLAQAGYADIHWSVPKFDVDGDLDLIPQLQALGVTDIFESDAADFSPLTNLDAVVSAAKHAARVKVDEEGCEAAAFTAITVDATSAMPEQLPIVEMNLNRPFGFLITGADGLPLFMSIVNTMA